MTECNKHICAQIILMCLLLFVFVSYFPGRLLSFFPSLSHNYPDRFHIPPSLITFHHFSPSSLFLSPLKIPHSSRRAISLLWALGARWVLRIPSPREESTRKPPPLHHGEGGVFKLGSSSERSLLPAQLEAACCRRQSERLTRFSSSWFLKLASQMSPTRTWVAVSRMSLLLWRNKTAGGQNKLLWPVEGPLKLYGTRFWHIISSDPLTCLESVSVKRLIWKQL